MKSTAILSRNRFSCAACDLLYEYGIASVCPLDEDGQPGANCKRTGSSSRMQHRRIL